MKIFPLEVKLEKRYQVFISSTYDDLREERTEVMQALLELDCMPSGMELFPASNETQWNWIKRVIDESDYYVVIVGGRYGSIDKETGQSYTEKEYRYAVEKKKPVIAFLHKAPEKIASGKTENNDEGRKKLERFRGLVQTKLCRYWETPADLGTVVSRRIVQLKKNHPAVGWVRADSFVEENPKEILALKRSIEALEGELNKSNVRVPRGTKELSQGEELCEVKLHGYVRERTSENIFLPNNDLEIFNEVIMLSWNTIFLGLFSSSINHQVSEFDLEKHLLNLAISSYKDSSREEELKKKYPDKYDDITYKISSDSFDKIMIQFKALGLVSYSSIYWKLTETGKSKICKLLAVKSEKVQTEKTKSK